MSNSTKINSSNNETLCLDKVGIIYNLEHEGSVNIAKKIEETFNSKNVKTELQGISPKTKQQQREYINDATFAVVIGGDGTLLGAARFYAKYNVPVFGINAGRLGFLSQLKPENATEGIEKIFNGKFKIEERLMLKACEANKQSSFEYSALNDIVIKGGSLSRTARLFLHINGRHVCDYLADGLIISTPTGSTAYTLSAGGPVLVPELEAIVIVPICPHSLNARPLVIPANEEIQVKTCSNCDLIYLTADGQENFSLKSNDSVIIKKNEKKAKLVLLEKENNGFYTILRDKLHWGISPKG